ncbi:hypothetical protein C8R42DRAFT_638135 [Lentinula raphanica]|nr:hypothetical protein C8R42DRAFT_638135 [Lentinula raphanica]
MSRRATRRREDCEDEVTPTLFPFALDYPEVSLLPPVERQWGNTKPASFYYLGWLITCDEKGQRLGKMGTSWGRTDFDRTRIQIYEHSSRLGVSQAQLSVYILINHAIEMYTLRKYGESIITEAIRVIGLSERNDLNVKD